MSGVRAVAIATHSPSHIDFGGGGFLRVMSGVAALGHDVQWVSVGRTADRLRVLGWPTHVVPEVGAARHVHRNAELPALEHACRRLVEVLRDLRAEILIVDRVNTLCSVVAQELELPIVAVGTPGGYWKYAEGGIRRTSSTPRAFAELAELLKTRLGWRQVTLHSAWLRSDDLNVTFLGRSFYGDSGESPERTAYVRLFEVGGHTSGIRRSLGIVLGNRGRLARMRLALSRLLEEGLIAADEPIDLLAGGRTDSTELRALLALLATHQVTTHGWVDYGELYSRMRGVISFGGTGAVWQAVNHRLPMLIVDGAVGDQRFNCLAIERLGMGEVLRQDADGRDLGESFARLQDAGSCLAAMDAFRAPENYSDSLESVVARIVRLADGGRSGA